MVAMERIAAMKSAMRRCLGNSEFMGECNLHARPFSMCVTFHDGPGVQFVDEAGKPLLPYLIREEELAFTLWNALTDNAPIDPEWFARPS